jgi:SAM-dependent methyltransferase
MNRSTEQVLSKEVDHHMSASETGAAPPADREAWRQELRRVDERQEDALAVDFDAHWGQIEPMHHAFVGRFLSRLPPDGRVLDAACGTGKYFSMVLASGRRLLGVDHAGALLARAAAKFPQVPTDQMACCAWMPWSSSHQRSGRRSWSGSAGPCAHKVGCT